MSAISELAIELDDLVKRTRRIYLACTALDDANQLGEAARAPDELARAIACLAGARNALSHEAVSRMEVAS